MALIKCKECGKEVSNQAAKCPNCGAPVKKSIGGFGLVVLIFMGMAILGIIISVIVSDHQPRSSSPSTTSRELRYNLSTDDLKAAQDKLGFVEAASWFGGDVNTGVAFNQYVNVVVASKRQQRQPLMSIVQFYRNRYQGCQWLKIDFYPSLKAAPKSKNDFQRLFGQPSDKSFAGYVFHPVNSQDTLVYY